MELGTFIGISGSLNLNFDLLTLQILTSDFNSELPTANIVSIPNNLFHRHVWFECRANTAIFPNFLLPFLASRVAFCWKGTTKQGMGWESISLSLLLCPFLLPFASSFFASHLLSYHRGSHLGAVHPSSISLCHFDYFKLPQKGIPHSSFLGYWRFVSENSENRCADTPKIAVMT